MMRILFFVFLLFSLSLSAHATTLTEAAHRAAVEKEAERIRTFQRVLGVIPEPVAPEGIKDMPLYAPVNDVKASERSHTVTAGETLYALSKRYDVSVADIRLANALGQNVIHPGQVIILPPTDTDEAAIHDHVTVGVKETLYAISRRSCVPVAELVSLNALAKPDQLTPGQRLSLPSGHCLNEGR